LEKIAMKKYALLITLTLVSTGVLWAQKEKWAPTDGFWVVTTKPGTPAVVRFYDLQQHLIYEEKLNQERLDIKKRKVRKALYQTLETALAVTSYFRPKSAGFSPQSPVSHFRMGLR
jgi:hypothetical protein